MGLYTFDIEEPSTGLKVGDGPLLTVQTARRVDRVDAAGEVTTNLPATEQRIANITAGRLLRGWTIRGGQRYQAITGIAQKRTLKVSPDQEPSMEITGPNIGGELVYRRVGGLQLLSGTSPITPAAALALVMAVMPSSGPAAWTFDATTYGTTGTTASGNNTITGVVNSGNFQQNDPISGAGIPAGTTVSSVTSTTIVLSANATASASGVVLTRPCVYYSCQNETALAVLVKMVELSGEHFRLEGRKIVWLGRMQVASGIRAVQGVDPTAVLQNPDVCLITDLQEVSDATQVITRITPKGSGSGSATSTLAGCTRTPPTGYTVDTANNWIIYTATDSVYRIDGEYTAKDVGPATSAAADSVSAANQLFDAALAELRRRIVEAKTYSLTVTKVDKDLLPGMTIKVIWAGWINTHQWVSINRDLFVLECSADVDNTTGGELVQLTVSTVDRPPLQDTGVISKFARMTVADSTHDQVATRALTADSTSDTNVAKLNVAATFTQVMQFDGGAFINGKLRLKRSTFAASATIGTTTLIAAVTNTSSPRTITLPTGASAGTQTVYIIKDETGAAATNNITVAGNGSELIEGAGTKTINTNYGVLRVYWNGTQWMTW